MCVVPGTPAQLGVVAHFFPGLTAIVRAAHRAVFGLAPSTTSQHVSVLKDAGLLLGSAEDQRTCYCVNTERLASMKQLVESL